jgi:sigma-E factor negative regulatory protein RseC
MMETRVRVIRSTPDMAWVEPVEAQGCAACQAQSACGVSGLGRLFARRRPVPVPCSDAAVGERLVVRLEEGDLLRAGLLAYLLAAGAAVTGAMLAAAFGLGDGGAVGAAGLGLGAGLLLARLMAGRARLTAHRPDDSATRGASP